MNFDGFLDAVGLKAVSGSDRYVAIYLVFETSTHHNNLDFSHRHTLSLRQVASHWVETEVRSRLRSTLPAALMAHIDVDVLDLVCASLPVPDARPPGAWVTSLTSPESSRAAWVYPPLPVGLPDTHAVAQSSSNAVAWDHAVVPARVRPPMPPVEVACAPSVASGVNDEPRVSVGVSETQDRSDSEETEALDL